jgi:hypothetical protein
MLASVFLIFNCGNCGVIFADSDNTARKQNIKECIAEFLKSLPDEVKASNFLVTDAESQKQPAWLEDGVINSLVAEKITIISQVTTGADKAVPNNYYILGYKLVEENKDSLKIAFRLTDARTDKLAYYVSVKNGAASKTEKYNYEHRVAPKPYVKHEGTQWGLLILFGLVVAGIALQPKI